MSLINMAKREINCKIVYYGIGLSGKTTNLHYIHKAVNSQDVGDMVSIDTETERTLYFDLLPLELGKVHGFQIRFQLYTVPGQILYQQTRISVLKGADCVIYVADSQASKLQDRKSTRLNSSHTVISYAVFCLKKKKKKIINNIIKSVVQIKLGVNVPSHVQPYQPM